MARHGALPPTLQPRLVSREAAAAYVSISPGLFDRMVEDGSMPRPRLLGGRRKGWDIREIDVAVDRLPVEPGGIDETWADADGAQASASR